MDSKTFISKSIHLIAVSLFSFAHSACITKPFNQNNFSPDLDLITPYTHEVEKEAPFAPPYFAIYTSGEKKLFYLAATHASVVDGYHDLLQHPTFRSIQKIFVENPIDAVIVEGIAPWQGEIPKRLLAHGDECEKTGYITNCGEPWYTIQLAKKHGAQILTGEPSESEILKYILEKGFSAEDLLGFYVTRQIPEWKREGLFNAKSAQKLIADFLSKHKMRFEIAHTFGFQQYDSWYKAHMNNPKSFHKIETDDSAPIGGSTATYVQNLAALVDIERNRSIVNRISDSLKFNKKVLVVYGASHLLVQREALKQWLGNPDYKKLY